MESHDEQKIKGERKRSENTGDLTVIADAAKENFEVSEPMI